MEIKHAALSRAIRSLGRGTGEGARDSSRVLLGGVSYLHAERLINSRSAARENISLLAEICVLFLITSESAISRAGTRLMSEMTRAE